VRGTGCGGLGAPTPGVQRQYLGCVGKVEHGIITVHIAVTRGTFQALADADLYLPKGWDADRDRCRAAGIPGDVRYRPKWRIAPDEWARLERNGVCPDWLVFDEGYGAAVPMLRVLNLAGRAFVAEVPVNFAVRDAADGPSRRADATLTAADATGGRRYRLARRTTAGAAWRAATATVWAAGREHTLVAAINEATAEVKYFLTNATAEPVARVLAAAFRRATVEHAFRLAKQEAGLTHFEGRDHTGLIRHLILALIVLGFVAVHTERLRGEKPARHRRAGVPGVEPAVRGRVPSKTRGRRRAAPRHGDPLPSAAK
jgi:SRSO17 transposase